MNEPDLCGCCGRARTGTDPFFCIECQKHVGPRHLPPWDRTFFARHGRCCPYDQQPEELQR